MGFRIHKMCGYGLGDVTPEDERINWDSWFFTGANAKVKFNEYLEFIKTRDTTEQYILPSLDVNAQYAFYESINMVDMESDEVEPLTLCIKPLWCTDWYRSDSILDWLECPDREFMAVQTQWLQRGIHPWNVKLVDSRTNDPVPKDSMDFISFLWDEDKEEVVDLVLNDTLLKPLGLTLEEAREVIVPEVPDDVQSLVAFAELFKDENTVYSLRPLIMTWWA